MRPLFVLPAFLLTSALLVAQQGAPVPVQDPAQLDEVLAGWEKAMTGLRSLYVECHRTTLDKVFQTREVFKGSAKYLKSPGPGQGSRASLELYKETAQGLSPLIFEKYICTGTYLYEYSPANKVIRIHDLPPPKAGQVADDNFLAFLFGMKAIDAKQKYQLTRTPSDQYYHYLQIQPKLPADKADFTTARLVLLRSNSLPAQVWFHQPNGNEVTWDFMRAQPGAQLPPSDFEQPKPPPGWSFERNTDTKPKIRSTGP